MRLEDVQESIAKARELLTSTRIYGEPLERDGVTVIPAIAVSGGAGGGGGEDANEGSTGGGTGFGLNARPVGALVISDGRVRWEPAKDVTQMAQRAITMAGLIAIAAVLFGRG